MPTTWNLHWLCDDSLADDWVVEIEHSSLLVISPVEYCCAIAAIIPAQLIFSTCVCLSDLLLVNLRIDTRSQLWWGKILTDIGDLWLFVVIFLKAVLDFSL